MVHKVYVTYNEVHKACQNSADRILNDFKPQLMVAIGGGGYVPARILRSFLKRPGAPNIPIQAIGLSLYETLTTSSATHPDPSSPTTTTTTTTPSNNTSNADDHSKDDHVIEEPGTKVTRTQWLDLSSLEMANLIGKSVLIVDEVDDTRTTLEYAVRELQKDVDEAARRAGRTGERTRFSVFVLHNKDKEKKGHLPREMMEEGRYLAAETVGDEWICYPWEATDIDAHDELAARQRRDG